MVEDRQKWEKRKKDLLENIEEVIVSGSPVNKDVYLIMRELLLTSKTQKSISEYYKQKDNN